MHLHLVKVDFLNYLKLRNRSDQTITAYDKSLKVFQLFLNTEVKANIHIEEIKEENLEKYMQYLLLERKLSAKSTNNYIIAIRSMYNFAFKKRIVKENVAQYIDNISYEKKERAYLNERELQLLLEQIDHVVGKIAIATLVYTGLRISELLNLTMDDIDLENRTIKVLGKGKKERVIPISDVLLSLLQTYINKSYPLNTNFVFATKKTGKISAQYVNKMIRQAAKKAGLRKTVSAHTLRHSFASYLVKEHVDIATLQRLLGHSNIKTTSIYLHVDNQQMKDAVNLMRGNLVQSL